MCLNLPDLTTSLRVHGRCVKLKVHFIVYGCKSCRETDVIKQRAVRNISALILGNLLQDLYTNTSRDGT